MSQEHLLLAGHARQFFFFCSCTHNKDYIKNTDCTLSFKRLYPFGGKIFKKMGKIIEKGMPGPFSSDSMHDRKNVCKCKFKLTSLICIIGLDTLNASGIAIIIQAVVGVLEIVLCIIAIVHIVLEILIVHRHGWKDKKKIT